MKSSIIQPWYGEVQDIPDFATITSSSYTVKSLDFGKTLICNSSADQTITLPPLGKGFNFKIIRIGAGRVILSAASGITIVGSTEMIRYKQIPVIAYTDTIYSAEEVGSSQTKLVAFTEDATSTSHVGTVPIPAGAWLDNIQVLSSVLWGGGTATMKVGDTADDDGYFTGIDLKATDLLVGEVLDTTPSTSWGGKEGAYLVAASGRRGPTSSNFSKYYAAGSNIIGTVTVGTPGSTAGRTFMRVSYSLGETISAVAS